MNNMVKPCPDSSLKFYVNMLTLHLAAPRAVVSLFFIPVEINQLLLPSKF